MKSPLDVRIALGTMLMQIPCYALQTKNCLLFQSGLKAGDLKWKTWNIVMIQTHEESIHLF